MIKSEPPVAPLFLSAHPLHFSRRRSKTSRVRTTVLRQRPKSPGQRPFPRRLAAQPHFRRACKLAHTAADVQRACRHSGSRPAAPTRDPHRPAGRWSRLRAHPCKGREGMRLHVPVLTCDVILLHLFASLRCAGWQWRGPSRCPLSPRRWPQCTGERGKRFVRDQRRPYSCGAISMPSCFSTARASAMGARRPLQGCSRSTAR